MTKVDEGEREASRILLPVPPLLSFLFVVAVFFAPGTRLVQSRHQRDVAVGSGRLAIVDATVAAAVVAVEDGDPVDVDDAAGLEDLVAAVLGDVAASVDGVAVVVVDVAVAAVDDMAAVAESVVVAAEGVAVDVEEAAAVVDLAVAAAVDDVAPSAAVVDGIAVVA